MTQRSGRPLAVGTLLFMVSQAWPAAAVVQAGGHSVRVESAAEVLALADEAHRRGDVALAETMLRAVLQDPDRQARAEARFRLAKLAAAAGRLTEAAVLLRRVLDDHPEAAPARLELAAVLNQMGKEEFALRELRALRTTDLPPNVARFVDRWSASLQANKPFGVQLEMAVAPDSNINHATTSDTLGTVFGDFIIEEESKSKSGLGLAARAFAHRRVALTPGVNLVARAIADLNLYRDKDFNEIFAELSVGPEFTLSGVRFTADVGLGQRWHGMDPFHRQWRLSASATKALGAVTQARIDASYRSTDYSLNDLQDGSGRTLSLRMERSFSPKFSVSAFAAVDRFKARDDAYSTRSWAGGLTAYRDVGRMTLSLGGEIGRLEADERLSLLPEAREDHYRRLTVGAVFRQVTVAGFAPIMRLLIERNRSTVEFYDFQRTRTEFGISRAF